MTPHTRIPHESARGSVGDEDPAPEPEEHAPPAPSEALQRTIGALWAILAARGETQTPASDDPAARPTPEEAADADGP